MKKTLVIVPVVAALVTGCSGMSDTQQRTLSGGAIGAAAGAGITAIATGGPYAIWGAVGGAAIGALGGYAYDQYEKSRERQFNEGYQAGRKSATSGSPAGSITGSN